MDILSLEKFWQLIHEKVEAWVELSIKNVPNLIVAIIIFVLFLFLSSLIAKWSLKLLKRASNSVQVAGLLAAIIKLIVIAIGFFFALDIMGLSGAVASLLAGAGIIGLAIGFAFQDMTENLIAGVVMGIRKPFRVGDIVETSDTFGTVKQINLRNTLIENFYGQLHIIPNKMLFKHDLKNYSSTGKRRIEVAVGISYADDIDKARDVIEKAINEHEFVINKQETAVYASHFGDSAINLLVWFWIAYPGNGNFMDIRHKAIVTINKALNENDILIPFPIRTLDFNAKGGKTLQDMQKHDE
ncbi:MULTISPECIES: mechanosensitive ion channel family protein [Pseudoalteromonas]|uniref:Small-conductance mechanosensitive channel n=1 Tax=Pseudoalteromonas amylolytica TaxID=1859457 RepID=A0A1S1ML25_9GAMM|nr:MULTISPECIES: mechanosensitive ion channel family protein [Pseudoalteromonas]OHU86788.1 mechanosensitive ion channel protein [Pseudoalteromonas sp. JW3]OHU88687.1 mechanosensitive ion channel protein [Pseudoalteromonas amylolytica]